MAKLRSKIILKVCEYEEKHKVVRYWLTNDQSVYFVLRFLNWK